MVRLLPALAHPTCSPPLITQREPVPVTSEVLLLPDAPRPIVAPGTIFTCPPLEIVRLLPAPLLPNVKPIPVGLNNSELAPVTVSVLLLLETSLPTMFSRRSG